MSSGHLFAVDQRRALTRPACRNSPFAAFAGQDSAARSRSSLSCSSSHASGSIPNDRMALRMKSGLFPRVCRRRDMPLAS